VSAVIIRVFRAGLRPGKLAAFARVYEDYSRPMMRAASGCLAERAGPPAGRRDEFVIVSVWRDLESLKAFAGEAWQEAIILPGEAVLLHTASVRHFDESYHSLTQAYAVSGGVLREREAAAVRELRLSDAQWERARALLPERNREGRPRADDRRTLEGILYILRTGAPWGDLPREYGSPVTCWRRLAEWEASGVWERVWATLLASLTTPERLIWVGAVGNLRLTPQRRTRKSMTNPATMRARSYANTSVEGAG
jgi:transposase/quinol monooxygenase YgiN